MPSKKKKNMRRKKQYKTMRSNPPSVVDTEEQKQSAKQQIKSEHGDRSKPIAHLQRKKCLSLIENVAHKLKLENNSKLISILETIFTIFNGDVKKRSARLELISDLLSNVKEYDPVSVSATNALKNQLNLIFFPKELKNIMVEPSELEEEGCVILFFLFGAYGTKAYLNRGRRVRVIIRESNGDGDFKIIQEAKLLSQLRHDNIIRILGFDKTGSRIALEYLKLGALSDALEEYNFSPERQLGILKEITSGMMYLAERHYVLRNLNTGNVFLDSRGKCKIGNLAYCQYVGDCDGIYTDKDTDLDIELAAPEVREAKKFSTKSDAWDLGLLTWELYHVKPEHNMISNFCAKVLKVDLLTVFIATGRLPKPQGITIVRWEKFKDTLLDEDPSRRSTFAEIMKMLEKF